MVYIYCIKKADSFIFCYLHFLNEYQKKYLSANLLL